MSKVVPIGGQHQSVHSLLAEVMADESIKKCVIVTFGDNETVGWALFQMSAPELLYAAEVARRLAFEDELP